jgi:hypothetical protein
MGIVGLKPKTSVLLGSVEHFGRNPLGLAFPFTVTREVRAIGRFLRARLNAHEPLKCV